MLQIYRYFFSCYSEYDEQYKRIGEHGDKDLPPFPCPEARRREKGLQYNMPVHIGKNCWIGAGALIMPGVTIGDNAVIGAGSVVTKDIPSNVVAVGNPCRLLRPVGDKDRKYYFRGRKIPKEFLED